MIALGLGTLVLGAGALFFFTSASPDVAQRAATDDPQQNNTSAQQRATQNTDTRIAQGEPATAGSGVYAPYAPERVGQTARTILSFSAPWCTSCQAFEEDITQHAAEIPAGVTILKVDYDARDDLKKRYGVRSQNTFVEVDKDGNVVKSVVGVRNLATLVRVFEL